MTMRIARYTCALLLFTVLAGGTPPAADAYTFARIADTGGGFTFPDPPLPAINGAGSVAFGGVRSGQEGVFSGTGGSVTTIAVVGATFSAFGLPAIASDGTVAFPASLVAGGAGVFRGSGGGTTIASSAGDLDTFAGACALGAGGVVAFQAVRDDGSQGIFTGVGAAVTVVVDSVSEALTEFGVPSLSSTGTVAFRAVRTAGGIAIFTAQAGAPAAVVAESGSVFSDFGQFPAINAGGTVAFQAALAGGGQGIFTAAPGAAPVTVATTEDGFTALGSVAINGNGAVAFLATVGGATGIYTGPDASRQKVIAVGDALGGSTVVALEFGRDGLNDTGQVAFYAELASGVKSVYRANAPNLRVTTLTLSPAVGGPGATVTATDTTKNVGPGHASSTVTRFYYSQDNVLDAADVELGTRAVVALAVGAEETGSVALTLPASATSGTAFIIAKADGSGDVVEASETDNNRTASIKLGPDLRVAVVTAPASVAPGDTIAIGDTTENQGGAQAPATITRFFLSTDNLLDAGDTLLGERPVGVLAGLASDTGSTNVTLPGNLTQGTYFIIARADATDLVTETSETNNVKVRSVTMGVDLVVIGLSAPDGGAAGQPISVTETTRNAGGGPAGASSTKIFLSTDNVLDGADTLLGTHAVPALAGGASDTATTVVTIPASAGPGSYFLLVKADADEAVAESSETNNVLAKAFGIGADMIVQTFTTPPTAATGAVVQVTDGTRNNGAGPAAATTTTFYLSADATLDASDTLLGSRAVPALPSGTTNMATTSLTLPAGVAGNLFLIARADEGDVVPEKTEINNTVARAIAIGADLVIATMTASPSASGTVAVTETTQNIGPAEAPASTTVYYLSADNVFDSGDTPLGSRSIPALAPGASSAGTVSLALPPGPAGSMFIIARADGEAVVPEVLETNNTTTRAVTIGADLVVSSFTASVSKTGNVVVSDTTRNIGPGAAAATTTIYYLSTDNALDAGDTPLGSRPIPALAAGASSADSVSLPLPPGAAGSVFVIARADGDAVVPEVLETNNTQAVPLSVGPDLRITGLSITPTKNLTAGTVLTLADTVQNAGVTSARSTETRFFFSVDAILDPSDTPLGARTVPQLATRATSVGSTQVTIPAGTVAGRYYVIAVADADGTEPETVETNNVLSQRVTVN
jgi:subtilase family serine protease